jgi:hypothetical protein
MTTAIAPRQGRRYGCRQDGNSVCPARVRIVAEPLEAYVEGSVIEELRNPEAIKIAQSDDDRMAHIREINDEMPDPSLVWEDLSVVRPRRRSLAPRVLV